MFCDLCQLGKRTVITHMMTFKPAERHIAPSPSLGFPSQIDTPSPSHLLTWLHVTFVTRPVYDHRTMPCLQLPRSMACEMIAKAPCSVQDPTVHEVIPLCRIGTRMRCGGTHRCMSSGQFCFFTWAPCKLWTLEDSRSIRHFIPDEFRCGCHLKHRAIYVAVLPPE